MSKSLFNQKLSQQIQSPLKTYHITSQKLLVNSLVTLLESHIRRLQLCRGACSRRRRTSVPYHVPKRRPELPGHGTVEDEVDCPVEEGQGIHHLPEEIIAALEETPA